MKKSKDQTAAGEKENFSYYVIRYHQHDMDAKNELLRILFEQGIQMYHLADDVICEEISIEKDSVFIPVAQPKYALIMELLEKNKIHSVGHPKRNSHLAVNEIGSLFHVKIEKIQAVSDSILSEYKHSPCDVEGLLYQNTQSYLKVNMILNSGGKVSRDNHGFQLSGAREIKSAKIGIYARYFTGNMEQGWTRCVLDKFNFNNKLVRDMDILNGLNDIDILILPDDNIKLLKGEVCPERIPTIGIQPEKYLSGIKEKETACLIKFVSEGGKLIAFNKSCSYVIEEFGLSLKNYMDDMKENCNLTGSIYKMKAEHGLADSGTMEDVNIIYLDSPYFSITDYQNREDYKILGEYPDSDLLESGYSVGEKHLANKASIIKIKYKRGEILIFGFSPIYRAQPYNTFKLLFNELYMEDL